MKFLSICLMSFILVGCASTQDPKIVKEYVYVKDKIPSELLVRSKLPEPIDLNTATQLEVSNWIILNEKYLIELESKLDGIIQWNNK